MRSFYFESRLQQNVALKIMKADSSKDHQELDLLRHIAKAEDSHPGKNYVLELLDHFEHRGPNGTHLCLVLPFMFSDAQLINDEFEKRQAKYVRDLGSRILLGLDFLHAIGIIHGGQ